MTQNINEIIKALLTFLGIILTYTIADKKFKHDLYTKHQDIAKEKLDSIYSFLYIKVSNTDIESKLFSNDDVDKIIKYYYLIDERTELSLSKIIMLENKNVIESNEYKKYRENFSETVKREHTELKMIYFNGFERKRRELKTDRVTLVSEQMAKFSKFIFLLTLVLVYIAFMYNDFSTNLQNETGLHPIVAVVIVFWSLGVLIGFLNIIIDFFSAFSNALSKKKKRYKVDSLVTVSGFYECRVCNESKYLYAGTPFPQCSSSVNRGNILRKLFMTYIWETKKRIKLDDFKVFE